MERLTKRVDGIAVLESWAVDKDPVSVIQRLCNRLAAYEDTGIDPDELRIIGDIKCFKNEIIFGSKADRLKELSDAYKYGRLVVLPCKVGDTVYAAETSPVIPLSVAYVGVYLDGANGGDWEALENIGKTVFLTREEAEAVLAGKGGEG